MNINDLNLKPFISRMGNKYRHIKHFINYIPKDYNTYIEPFVGSGSLLLYLKPKKWIINDLNNDIMNLWNIIKENPSYLINKLKLFANKYLKYTKHEDKIIFLKKETEKLNNMKESKDKTILWLILNKLSYMSVLQIINDKYMYSRTNNPNNYPGIFKINYYNLLNNINSYLNNSKGSIYNTDYKNILKKAKENDFIFLDPPYIDFDNSGYKYNKTEKLNNKFLIELRNEVKKLDSKNIKWMMTQDDSKEVKEIFKEYKIRKYKIYRILLKSYKYELFITNY